ncbi:MAG: bifunctional heptose 7-phosphate kinase/heptose 1-phosphate adenyltransferase [Chloroflexota bacterium]|nr:MAG: carbohydrate kinase [Chloroflexota bacterium]
MTQSDLETPPSHSQSEPGLLDRFADRKVLVLGDMVADEYVMGRPARISREAPVLILHFAESFVRPGGATNTAYNISTLGAAAQVVGVIGDDEMGRRLRNALDGAGISTAGMVVDPGRPTSTKTRVIAKGTQEVQQQVVRIDRIDPSTVDGGIRDRMIDALRSALCHVDSLLISDYENGVISPEVLEGCLPVARRKGLTVTVDAHGDLLRFRGVTAATPNQPEAELTLGVRIMDDADLRDAGEELLRTMDARGVLITRGSEGIALFERDREPYILPISITDDSEVVDPTGAGDTVAAVFTLAIASGAPMRLAAYLGNVAGGEIVRRLGAAALTRQDLAAAMSRTHLAAPA